MVRRILRVIAPEYRIMANSGLEAYQSALDLKKKTVEVGENTPIFDGVAILLFQIGHLILADRPEFGYFFGKNIAKWKYSEKTLVNKIIALGMMADQIAFEWASEVMAQYWPMALNETQQLVQRNIWTKDEWTQYFNVN